MFGFDKISRLKNNAREHYLAYRDAVGNLSCGAALAEHVSTDVLHHKVAFNRCMDELREIDPTAPDTRL